MLAPGGSDTTNATAAALTDGQLQESIDEATAQVNGKARGAPYNDPAPPLIAQVTRDLAAYFATLTHRRSQPLPADHPVALRYAAASRMLDGMQKGTVELPAPPAGSVEASAVVNQLDGALFPLEGLGLGYGAPFSEREWWPR